MTTNSTTTAIASTITDPTEKLHYVVGAFYRMQGGLNVIGDG